MIEFPSLEGVPNLGLASGALLQESSRGQAASPKHPPFLIGTGVFAMLWVLARACVQSITIDEADTYLYNVRRSPIAHWDASANNHVLNSLLMSLVTSIFGASPIAIRLPALIGSALYIGAAYLLVRLITPKRLLQWSLLVCLTCSPFVMDYLVAARGYSMASAFLLWMVAIAARHQARDPKLRAAELWRTCTLISVCGALSIAANFSFAIADMLTALGLFLWICREERGSYFKILAGFTLPGLAVGYFLVGSVVLGWPKGQFTWGADSLLKTITSLVTASLYQPNEALLNPRIHHYFVHFGTWFYPILAAFAVWRVVMQILAKQSNPVALICGGGLLLALACHEFLLLAYGILLPLDRTAMWVVLLFLAAAGALAAAQLDSFIARASGKALTAILFLIAVYNLGCLRLTYFNEWKYDADMKNVYNVLAYYNHTYGVTKVQTNWRYVAALNCYRVLSGKETIEEFPGAPSVVNVYPPGYQAYVFFYPVDEDFYKREGLKLVYHDRFSDVAIGIRPEVESGHAVTPP
jgi:hypothetical protein